MEKKKNTLVSFYFLSFPTKVSVACNQTIPILGINLTDIVVTGN